MDLNLFEKKNDFEWHIHPHGEMRVPAIIYASEELIQQMDLKVYQQITNVSKLPGIVKAAYAMPDAHWGYGFPIGGVAAFDADQNGIVSAGGVGFDISCGVRLLRTGIKKDEILPHKEKLAGILFKKIPAGVASKSHLRLSESDLDNMLRGGAQWAVNQGFGAKEDLEYIEEQGCIAGANPDEISPRARERQRPEMGTLGSGNHYLEVQEVTEIFNSKAAQIFKISLGDILISIHCGSRGLGHQVGTEFLKTMALEANRYGIKLPDRELACAPLRSQTGISYLGAMRAAVNCALANRQILTHFTREAFQEIFTKQNLSLLYDVSHNTCKEEWHEIDQQRKKLFVHRKGATRAFGPQHSDLPKAYKDIGQPVIIGGSMGTGSYILVGSSESETKSFSSACHGAGRALSRTQALKNWDGQKIVQDLSKKGIYIRTSSYRGVAEEAPSAYKDVNTVVNAADQAGLAYKVAHLTPHICIKG